MAVRLIEGNINSDRDYILHRIISIVKEAIKQDYSFSKVADIFYDLDIEPLDNDDVTAKEFYDKLSDAELVKLYANLIDKISTDSLDDFFWALKYDNGKYTDTYYSPNELEAIKDVCKLINNEYNLSLPTDF